MKFLGFGCLSRAKHSIPESARILLSAFLDQTVVEFCPTPTEYSFALEKQNFTVHRMDFAATVRMEDGRHR